MISQVSTLYVSKCESKFDERGLFFRYFVVLEPGELKVEVSKAFFEEAIRQMTEGNVPEVSLGMK